MTDTEILVTLLCSSQVLHETLDELQDTSFYRHSLKQSAVRFEKELTKHCDPAINKSFPQDPEVFNAVMDGIKKVSKQLATLSPDRIAYLVQVIDKELNNQNQN